MPLERSIVAPVAGPAVAGPKRPADSPRPEPLISWARTMSEVTGIPWQALRAYGRTELLMREETPSCRLGWVTLAGIARVESDHARFGGSRLREDGRTTRPIIGVALDGTGAVAHIADTDNGELDGDADYDRAVGPMQFIPATWRRFGADGNRDGRADPQQIDDAVLAAGRYLCASGRDMASGGGWWSGVMSYNNSAAYGREVLEWANTYARLAGHR
ncbi:MAG: lytic transglycosylase domain-containing protein [Dehalococcoidia bacterium]